LEEPRGFHELAGALLPEIGGGSLEATVADAITKCSINHVGAVAVVDPKTGLPEFYH